MSPNHWIATVPLSLLALISLSGCAGFAQGFAQGMGGYYPQTQSNYAPQQYGRPRQGTASNGTSNNCGYKSDGNYHCGDNCGYKSDGEYHCGDNCGYKSDGEYHCEGEGGSAGRSPAAIANPASSTCGYKSDGNYHCGDNCGYKSDGNYHCGDNCGFKSDGKYHCIGEE